MSHRRTAAIAATFALLLAAPVRAQDPEPLITDRPDFTESTSAVGRGRVQLEAGYTYTTEGSSIQHTVGEVLLRVGLSDRLEARMGVNSYQFFDDPGGPHISAREDMSLGGKVELLHATPLTPLRPDIALLFGTTLPTGGSALRSDRLQPEATLAFGWSLGERAALSSNLNYARSSEAGRPFHDLGASLSLGIAAASRVGVYAEVYGFAPETNANSAFANAGLTFLLSPNAQLDARFGTAVTGSSARFFGVGFARRF